MLKLIQIIRYMIGNGNTKHDILLTIQEIVDNNDWTNTGFELSESDYMAIVRVYENDELFETAFKTALMK